MSSAEAPVVFFVLNGLLNGNEGEIACRPGPSSGSILSCKMKDGWYFSLDDGEDPRGPFSSKQYVEESAHAWAEQASREKEARRIAVERAASRLLGMRNRDATLIISTLVAEGLILLPTEQKDPAP